MALRRLGVLVVAAVVVLAVGVPAALGAEVSAKEGRIASVSQRRDGNDSDVAQARVHEQSTDPNQPQKDYEIFVMNADGSGVRQLTVNDVVDEAPTWSPDGRRIAFNSGFTPRPA